MELAELKNIVRRYLLDPDGKVWNDDELEQMIRRAARRYSEDAACFHGFFDFVPEADGSYVYPEDFISFLVGWNKDGRDVFAGAEYEVPGWEMERPGAPRIIYDDLTGPGKYRLAPNPAGEQARINLTIDAFGEVIPPQFGVVDCGPGVVCRAIGYNFAGDAVYVRYAEAREIRDYMALVYHALYQAHSTDAELSNPSYAQWCLARYNERVAMFRQVKHKNSGLARPGNFF